jgi:hypothetical protein
VGKEGRPEVCHEVPVKQRERGADRSRASIPVRDSENRVRMSHSAHPSAR